MGSALGTKASRWYTAPTVQWVDLQEIHRSSRRLIDVWAAAIDHAAFEAIDAGFDYKRMTYVRPNSETTELWAETTIFRGKIYGLPLYRISLRFDSPYIKVFGEWLL